jgi:hypothetical protein
MQKTILPWACLSLLCALCALTPPARAHAQAFETPASEADIAPAGPSEARPREASAQHAHEPQAAPEARIDTSLRLAKGLAITGGVLMGAGVLGVLAVVLGDVADTHHGEVQLMILAGSLGAHVVGAALLSTGLVLRRRQLSRQQKRTIARLTEHDEFGREDHWARAQRRPLEKRGLVPTAFLAPHGAGLGLRVSL